MLDTVILPAAGGAFSLDGMVWNNLHVALSSSCNY